MHSFTGGFRMYDWLGVPKSTVGNALDGGDRGWSRGALARCMAHVMMGRRSDMMAQKDV